MKQVFSLIFILCHIPFVTKSQNSPPPSGGGSVFKPDNSIFSKMSDIIPPAPDASAIAKYGGINVELNTGYVNKSIELKAITNKSLSVPITLFYKSNGINVNQYPSRVGMGWAINIGGQISRVIHGADDFTKQRFVPNFNVQPNETDINTTNYCWHLLNDGNKDGEPDVFSFSAGSYSGRFIFDNTGNIIQLPVSNLNIEYNTNPQVTNWDFRITTPDGIQYYYGGNDAREEVKKAASAQGGQYAPSTWCLNKVIHPNGYYITFSYLASELIGPYIVGISQAQYKAPPDASLLVCGENGNCVNGLIPLVHDQQAYITSSLRYLDYITTSFGSSVTFEYSNDLYPERTITGINYYNENNKRVNRYVFSYTDEQPGNSYKLPFLTTIKEYDPQNILLNNGYSFSYYNMSNVPTRVVSFSQDHWGFYNGKANDCLIPKPDDEELALKFPMATANRAVDPQYSINGMLSEINYPTGGKDNLEYESNTVQELKDVNPYAEVYQVIIGNVFHGWSPEVESDLFTISYENKVKLTTSCTYVGNANFDSAHDAGRVRIKNLTTNEDVYDTTITPNSGNIIEFPILSSGTYKFYVSSYGVDIKTNANIKYRTGSSPNIQDITVPVGGLRVKKTITTNNTDNSTPIIKRYYYGTFSNLNYSSANPIGKPTYYTPYNLVVGINGDNCFMNFHTFEYLVLNYNSLNKLYLSDGKILEYNSVIESFGGDNFENGAIEHKFNTIYDFAPQQIRGTLDFNAPLTNTSYASKGEIETNVYTKKTTGLLKTSSVENDVTIDNTRKYNDLSFLSVFQTSNNLPCLATNSSGDIVGPFPLVHMAFVISKYYITSAWKYLSKKTEKHYDENGLNPITQVTNYYYDDDRNLMLSRTEILNSKGELMRQQNKYPHDFSSAGNVYEDMVNKNIIATPVQVKISKNGQDLFTQTTNYSNTWFADKHVVAIDNITEQKAGYAEDIRFKYYAYNTDGNPLELAKQSDARQSMIWDYKGNYPIAKVINASSNDIAYTSFEADGKGNWVFTGTASNDNTAPTGLKVYILNGSNNISKAGLNISQTYIVSYWIKNSSALNITGTQSGYPVSGKVLSGWRYFEHRISGQSNITISGVGSIDELRLYPIKSLMTTYTYEPMIGMTSQCDVNNKTTYYEYDGFNRLAIIRDQDKNILKKICYKYNGQVENCNTDCISISPYWQNTTTPLRCQQGSCGPTGYQEQEQIDMNPCSPSYGSKQWVMAGYNPTACPLQTCISLTSTNITGLSGYTASYYNTTSGITYNFSVSTTSGLQSLGNVPVGNYTLTISRTSGTPSYITFRSGCWRQLISGTSATFYNVAVSTTTCNSITLDIAN